MSRYQRTGRGLTGWGKTVVGNIGVFLLGLEAVDRKRRGCGGKVHDMLMKGRAKYE